MEWYHPDDRPLPWKANADIYSIWLSEIMLQQTRADQVVPYFERFVGQFPDLKSLAEAPEEEVMRYWQGLGYYHRAKNLHRAAKVIQFEKDGVFPRHYDDWLDLPGVGPYTAAAITSFALGLPHAVLDGNVFRLLARFFEIYLPTDNSRGRKEFEKLANELIDRDHPAKFNQAIMDFGATVCKPANPLCDHCPLNSQCGAYLSGSVAQLPLKKKKTAKKKWAITYLHITNGKQTLIHRRPTEGIWPGLYEFPRLPDREDLKTHLNDHFKLKIFSAHEPVQIKHQLTHRAVTANFYRVEVPDFTELKKDQLTLVNYENFPKFAFHRLMKKYFHIFTDNR